MTQQGEGEDSRPADEIREDLIEVQANMLDVLAEGKRKRDLIETHDPRIENYSEEHERLEKQVIAALTDAQKEVEQAIAAVAADHNAAANAQSVLERATEVFETAAETVEEVGLEELEDEDDDDDE